MTEVDTVVRAIALLPTELQAQLPRIALVPTPLTGPEATCYAWYSPTEVVIAVPTDSECFHDAMQGDATAELQLAAILVHELTHHLNPGADETAAYDAELRFLAEHHAPADLMAWAEDAKRLGLALERQLQPTHKEISMSKFVPRKLEDGRNCCAMKDGSRPESLCEKCTAHHARLDARARMPRPAPDPYKDGIATLRAASRTRLSTHTGTTGKEQYVAPDGYAENLRAYQEANR